MKTETKDAEYFLDQIHDGANFVSTVVVDSDKCVVISAMEKYSIHKSISVLNDNISRLEAQKLNLKTIVFDNKDHGEEIRLKGKVEGVNIAIENLRKEIQSLTSQMNEL